jgi:hypothetical protein
LATIKTFLSSKLLIFVLFPLGTWAQTAPKYSNEFLAIGVGARALGMSNTQTSVVDDVTAGYWNPAGLVNLKNKYEASLMHSAYQSGIANYDYAAFAVKIDDKSALAFSAIRLGIDNIPDTRFLFDNNGRINYNNVTAFSTADYGFLLSYASRSNLIKGLQLGGSFKTIYRTVGIFGSAWGFGLDAGAQLQRGTWHFGLMVRDITTTYNMWSYNSETLYATYAQTGNSISENAVEITIPRMLTDVAKSFKIKEKIGILVVTGFDITFDGARNVPLRSSTASLDPKAGLEIDYKKMIFLRSGVGSFQQIKNFDGSRYYTYQPNFGIGFQLKAFTIDYALTNVGGAATTLYSHIFSLKLGINPPRKTLSTPEDIPEE